MDTINRYFGGIKRTFHIYSQEEADAEGIKYLPWREARPGDWGLSDDGYVGECLTVKKYGGSLEYAFSFARLWGSKNAKLNYLERKATRSYHMVSTKPWAEREVTRGRAKRFILAYVMMFMAGGKIDWKKLGLIYRPDHKNKNPARNAQYLFKQEAFKRMIQEKMIEVFKDKNLTEGDVIDMFKEAYDKAKNTGNVKEMRKVAEDFRDLLDMLPEKPLRGMLPYGEDAEWSELDDDLEGAKELTGAVKKLPK